MKKLCYFLLAGALLLAGSCVNLDEINNRINELEKRLSKVESELGTLTTNTGGLKKSIEALEANVYVTMVRKDADGYTIFFSDNTTATLKDGADGKDATAPSIGVKMIDGVNVWTVNGEPLLDANGKPIPVTATVEAPEFKYENDTWYYRIGSGAWTECGSGTGCHCSITETDTEVIITIGGTTVVLPKNAGPALVPVETITLNGKRLLTATGKTLDLAAWFTVGPEDATDKTVNYVSDHPEIASVSAEGVVTGVAPGDAVITLTPKDGSEVEAKITVKVADLPVIAPREKSADILFHGCDGLDYFTKGADANRVISIETSGQKEGTGWYKTTTTKQPEMVVINRNTAVVNARMTSYHRGHVGFWFYIEPREDGNNAEKLTRKGRINGGRIELSHAGGGGANKSIYWDTKDILKNLNDGWNWIDLPFKNAKTNGDPYSLNPEGLNWFRIYMNGPAQLYDTYTYGIDDIVVWEDYAETTAPKQYLHDFESVTGFGSTAGVFYNVEDKSAAVEFPASAASVFQYPMGDKTVDSGATLANGHLHFKIYVSDMTKIPECTGQVELSSSGKSDEKELGWGTVSFLKYCQNGWNDVTLDFNRGSDAGCDLSAINWFRFYNKTGGDVLIQFKDVYVYAE